LCHNGRQGFQEQVRNAKPLRSRLLWYFTPNSGSVYKVKANDGAKQPNYYVAKKIFLEGISEE
jgi:hypothetical protein